MSQSRSTTTTTTATSSSSESESEYMPLKLYPRAAHPYIFLAIFTIPGKPRYFHWSLFVPQAPEFRATNRGWKMHAIGSDTIGWRYECAEFWLNTSRSVVAASIIGEMVRGVTVSTLDNILKTIPVGVIPEEDRHKERYFSCRVWVREAVRRLHRAGILRCTDIDGLEAEIYQVACEGADNIQQGSFARAQLIKSRHSNTYVPE